MTKKLIFDKPSLEQFRNGYILVNNTAIYAYSHKNQNVGILTSNYRDMPESLFRKVSFFSYEYGREIRTHAVYLTQSDQILEKTISKYSNQE